MKHTALVEYHQADDPGVLAVLIYRINDAGDEHQEVHAGSVTVPVNVTTDDLDTAARAAIEAADYEVNGERDGVDNLDLGGTLTAATWSYPVAATGTCCICGTYIVQAADGGWDDEYGRVGCGDDEHFPASTSGGN